MKRIQNRINRGKDGAAVAVGHDGVCDGSEDADGGLGSDLVQGLVNGWQPQEVDDLGILHSLSWCDIQSGHVAPDICVTDDGD